MIKSRLLRGQSKTINRTNYLTKELFDYSTQLGDPNYDNLSLAPDSNAANLPPVRLHTTDNNPIRDDHDSNPADPDHSLPAAGHKRTCLHPRTLPGPEFHLYSPR